jgi:RND family efflux transporter MFP subunit
MHTCFHRKWILSLAVFTLILIFSACKQKKNTYVPPPPPEVTIARPLQRDVTEYLEFTGNTRAVEAVEIRARVAGFLQSMHFTPGTMVKKGDLLFVIDPREYQAELNVNVAELNSAKAELRQAEIEFERAERLFKQQAGSEKNVVAWRSKRDIARATVERNRAEVARAQLRLSYTRVTTPVSGRVGRNLVDVGNLVGEGNPTLLTTVTQYDPMYAYFNLNERDLLRVRDMYRQRIAERGVDPRQEPASRAEIPVFLGLANEEGYPHKGTADFAESGLDPETGTLQLRGVFPNEGAAPFLVPGLFARLRMPVDEKENALLVTERAIGADQEGRFLLVVNGKSVVEKRTIQMGQLVDGLRVIGKGLQARDWVVVKGIQRARPGGKVTPERVMMSTLTTSAIRAAASKKTAPSPADTDSTSKDSNAKE